MLVDKEWKMVGSDINVPTKGGYNYNGRLRHYQKQMAQAHKQIIDKLIGNYAVFQAICDVFPARDIIENVLLPFIGCRTKEIEIKFENRIWSDMVYKYGLNGLYHPKKKVFDKNSRHIMFDLHDTKYGKLISSESYDKNYIEINVNHKHSIIETADPEHNPNEKRGKSFVQAKCSKDRRDKHNKKEYYRISIKDKLTEISRFHPKKYLKLREEILENKSNKYDDGTGFNPKIHNPQKWGNTKYFWYRRQTDFIGNRADEYNVSRHTKWRKEKKNPGCMRYNMPDVRSFS